MEGTLGEVRLFGGNYTPQNWAFCEGQILPIVDYNALYSVLGNRYGGNGRVTFALPDLRGRAQIGPSPNLPLGYNTGRETVVLNALEMPYHTHLASSSVSQISVPIAVNNAASTYTPTSDAFPGIASDVNGDSISLYANSGNPINSPVDPNIEVQLNPKGSGTPHDNMPPWLCLNYIICLAGNYPMRG